MLLEEVRTCAQNLKIGFLAQLYAKASYYLNVKENLPLSTNHEALIRAVQSLPPSCLREMQLKSLRGKSIKFPCFAVYTFCVFQPNGDIAPCFNLWDARVGNVKESTPTLIWHGAEAKKARRIIKNCQGCLNTWLSSGVLNPASCHCCHFVSEEHCTH